MRTNIVIDDKLMKKAMKVGHFKTKKDAVEAALKSLIQMQKQQEVLKLFGKYEWVGDLDAMRRD